MNSKNTSWGKVKEWYEEVLRDEDSYQAKVILPNLLRAMSIKAGETVLDLACGPGFFSHAFANAGAKVIGVDISKELIAVAKEKNPNADFYVSSADSLRKIQDKSIDKVVVVLALQNIANVKGALEEAKRVLCSRGRLYLVLNHPVFRIPKRSSWGWDEAEKLQYRRIDSYLSESKEEIVMHPSALKSTTTISFHRPLQYYFKLLGNAAFTTFRMEEWISHKKSESGPRQKAEDSARKEIPLFLFIEAVLI